MSERSKEAPANRPPEKEWHAFDEASRVLAVFRLQPCEKGYHLAYHASAEAIAHLFPVSDADPRPMVFPSVTACFRAIEQWGCHTMEKKWHMMVDALEEAVRTKIVPRHHATQDAAVTICEVIPQGLGLLPISELRIRGSSLVLDQIRKPETREEISPVVTLELMTTTLPYDAGDVLANRAMEVLLDMCTKRLSTCPLAADIRRLMQGNAHQFQVAKHRYTTFILWCIRRALFSHLHAHKNFNQIVEAFDWRAQSFVEELAGENILNAAFREFDAGFDNNQPLAGGTPGNLYWMAKAALNYIFLGRYPMQDPTVGFRGLALPQQVLIDIMNQVKSVSEELMKT